MTIQFNEQFEATGYDETSTGFGSDWTETNAGGGTLDPNYSVSSLEAIIGSSLPTWGSQCLKLSGGTSEVSIRNILDSSQTDLYIRFDLVIGDVSSLANSSDMAIFYPTYSGISATQIKLRKDGSGNLYLLCVVKNSGGDVNLPNSTGISVTANTKYRIDIHFVASGTCEFKFDGVSQGTGTTTTGGFERFWFLKGAASGTGYTQYFDNAQLSTDDWIPDDITTISGTTCWGHSTDAEITETNIRTFTTNWTGTGSVTGSGDSEKLKISSGQYMESEIVETGEEEIELTQNVYETGDDVILSYKTGATVEDCNADSWHEYSVPFDSTGYVKVKASVT